MTLEYRNTTDPLGVEVLDPLEQVSLHVSTSTNQFWDGPDDVPFEEFVDETIALETWYVEFDIGIFLVVLDEQMNFVARAVDQDLQTLPFGTYIVNIPTAVKSYLLFSGKPSIRVDEDGARIEFETVRRVVFGLRSNYTEPRSTIETTDRPSDIATTISALSGGITTTSPDRTFAALRSHPPRIEVGDELVIPDDVSLPATNIELVVPPRYGALFTAAPLTYYLSATLRIGDDPRLVVDGEQFPLGTEQPLEDDLVRTLQHVYFLDCLARSVGTFAHDPPADAELLSTLPFDLEWAYEADIEDRVKQYLQVPFDDTATEIPRFPMVAHVPARPDSLSSIPHVLHRFGLVRPARGTLMSPGQSAIPAFAREAQSADSSPATGVGHATRHVKLDARDDAITHAWFGPGVPTNGAKGLPKSFDNAFRGRTPKDTLGVLVVCNDEEMLPEHEVLDEFYDRRTGIERNVSLRSDVRTSDLSALLCDERYDLFHFIGHATESGLRCPDGYLDTGTVDSVGMDLFVLNACETYEQARRLVDGGAVAGVATNTQVANGDATTIGRDVSRLLSDGFSMSGAVELATVQLDVGSQYLVLGDGLSRYSRKENVAPTVIELERRGDDSFGIAVQTYIRGTDRFGSTTLNVIDTGEGTRWSETVLDPDTTSTHVLSREGLPEAVMGFGNGERGPPVRMHGELHWPTSEADVEALLDG
ncbi:hypothetical protein [Haloarchaeobius sp. DT45]|uniref:hypothetical protein n=1 Tax=Haloarchaeobius sp. DT45 TaxID=3446116 RepID=UPI003F6C9345